MAKSKLPLIGKIAIVTGAKRGIGKQVALTFAEAGADVAICTREVKDGQLEATAKEIRQLGRRSLPIQCDISIKSEVKHMVQQIINEFEVINILVNNAGIRSEKCSILDSSEENYDRVLDIDLKGFFLCSQVVGKYMVERGEGGSIINVSSVLGVNFGEYSRMRPGFGVYAIAKAGVNMLTKVMAFELGCYNIRVNAIAPTSVKTPMSAVWGDPEEENRTASYIPLGRVALTRDCAEAALFLASDASSFITGDTLLIDGGQLV